MPGPALSLCMLVKNEAHQLARCLDSVKELEPEVIVVDTGSSDGTQEIARAAGAEVVAFDFARVDFAAGRNAGLSRAHGRWILVLDADETLERASLALVRRILETSTKAGYYLERHNHASDSTTVNRDYVVRLFLNRPEHTYKGRVHETIDAAIEAGGGKLVPSEIQIQHRFVSNREARRRKNRWYVEILKEEIAADPADDSRLDFLAAEYHQLEMWQEAGAIIEELARRRPNDARAHLFAGTYHVLYTPDFVQARKDLNRALELQPGYAEAESFLRLLESKERESDEHLDGARH